MPNPLAPRASRWTLPLVVAITVLACAPAPATAQVQGMPAAVCDGLVEIPLTSAAADPLAGLTERHAQGKRDELWLAIERVLSKLEFGTAIDGATPRCSMSKPEAFHLKADYVAVSWIGQDPLSGKATLMRVVLHGSSEPGGRKEFVTDLPGVAVEEPSPKLMEIFLARSPQASLTSVFHASRDEAPIVAQIPDFARALAGPLIAGAAALGGTIANQASRKAAGVGDPEAPRPALWAQVSRLTLPYRRATVRLQSVAEDGVPPASLKKALARFAAAVPEKNAAYSMCARNYAAALDGVVAPLFATGGACATDTLDRACGMAFDRALQDAYAGWASSCVPGTTPTASDQAAVRLVDQSFRARFASARGVTADGDVTFHNRPLSHVSLGAGIAYIATASLSRPRAKLNDDGKYVPDPLTRSLTLAFVNWSPTGYDEKAATMSNAERFQVFVGGALTPDFGIVGGLNIQIVKGLGVAVGGGVLFGNGVDAAYLNAETPQGPADPNDPFSVTREKVLFVGLTYNFK